MITRGLFLAAGWFAISFIAALAGLRPHGRARRPRGPRGVIEGGVGLLASVGWLAAVLLLGDLWAILTFGVPGEIAGLTLVTFVFGLLWIAWLRDWNAFGQVMWTMAVVTTLTSVPGAA